MNEFELNNKIQDLEKRIEFLEQKLEKLLLILNRLADRLLKII